MRNSMTMALTVVLSCFVLFTMATGPMVLLLHRSVFLAILISLAFISYPLFSNSKWIFVGRVVDVILALIAIVACANIGWNQDFIMTELPEAATIDMALASTLVLIILELCRRAVGIIFTSLVAVGIIYALFGQELNGLFGHRGFGLQYLSEVMYLGEQGIWGGLLGITSTTIAAFIMFGSLLLSTGTGQTFVDIATRLGGASPGGAAKVATIASGLFGMLAGSSVANVATTGNITIPMMKRLDYPPRLAAAVEAVASTGGQLAPPILGATAFIMAEYLNISYWTIATAAIIPAFLFYLGIYSTIHVLAINTGLGRVSAGEMPNWKDTFSWRRIVPLIFAVGGIVFGIVRGNSLVLCVFLGTVGMVGSYCVARIRDRSSAVETGKNLWAGFVNGGAGMVMVGVLIAGAGILVSVINLTGLAGTISSLITQIVGQNLLVVGIVTGGVGLIMGMGLPTIAAYVLVASMMVAPLEAAGASGLTAHLFVLYYAALSAITPPVCVAVFIAAGIAKTSWIGVAIESLRLGAIKYFLPLMFLYYPAMLAQGSGLEIAYAFFKCILLTVSVSWLLGGARIFENRLMNIVACLLLAAFAAINSVYATIIATVMFVTLLIYWRKTVRPFPDQGVCQ